MARVSQTPEIPNRLAVAGGIIAAAVLAAGGVMWLRYGTTVFFQTLAAGLAACF